MVFLPLLLLLLLLVQQPCGAFRSPRHVPLLLHKQATEGSDPPPLLPPNPSVAVVDSTNKAIVVTESESITTLAELGAQLEFLSRAALIGLFTALAVVIFKLSIQELSSVLYESLADVLPKDPRFYWPQILFPLIGSAIVAALTKVKGLELRKGVDDIAKSIDLQTGVSYYNPVDQLARISAAVATLGSGCSLGPEGPAVEIGAGLSRVFSSIAGRSSTLRQQHHLFLAGTAAGVSAGFNAPLSGVFFAIECGNRFLSTNAVKLEDVEGEGGGDGPRADIAAIVISACIAALVVKAGLHEGNALSIQGNTFAMQSPLFELPLYLGLGLVSGVVSTLFTVMRDYFKSVFSADPSTVQGSDSLVKQAVAVVPLYLRPLFGGLACGVAAVYFPQSIFVGYATLDQLIAGKIHLSLPFLAQLLSLKVFLSAFSLGTGLIGGVFAPSLFFGAIAGTIYHDLIEISLNLVHLDDAGLLLTSAPAYATVGAAATLGALFRAPLTSTILLLEVTENHDIVLPVLLSSGVAGFFAELLKSNRKQKS